MKKVKSKVFLAPSLEIAQAVANPAATVEALI